ncbi:MAG: hypothetical protein ACREF9_06280 [Opitutaceae bacterium]
MPRVTPPGYEKKFADFIRLCLESKKSGVQQIVISNPSVIGDPHEEIIESLSRLAEAGLGLHITNAEGLSPAQGYSMN